MMDEGQNQKQEALEVAEEAREKEWTDPSFVAELFAGRFAWRLVREWPEQDEEDRARGDAFLEKLESVLRQHIDPDAVDANEEVPQAALDALAEIGCFGMKIDEEYGGLGLSNTNYTRAVALVSSHCASTAVWCAAA